MRCMRTPKTTKARNNKKRKNSAADCSVNFIFPLREMEIAISSNKSSIINCSVLFKLWDIIKNNVQKLTWIICLSSNLYAKSHNLIFLRIFTYNCRLRSLLSPRFGSSRTLWKADWGKCLCSTTTTWSSFFRFCFFLVFANKFTTELINVSQVGKAAPNNRSKYSSSSTLNASSAFLFLKENEK